MKRLVVLALAIAGLVGVVPATSSALPPGVVPGPNSITGTVTDDLGQPVGGVFVSESSFTASAYTEADGTYLLTGFAAGSEVTVTASDGSGRFREASSGPVVASGLEAVVVDFVLQPYPTSGVTGLVTDATGAPVDGVSVQLLEFFGLGTTTGPDGRFTIASPFLPEGTFTLYVDPGFVRPDLRPVNVPVTIVAGTTVDTSVQLDQVAMFDLVVTSGGAPADARVSVWSAANFGGVVSSATVGPDGTVSLPILYDGDYYLEISSLTAEFASEFFPDTVLRSDAQRFTITGGQHVAVNVELEVSASISGTITLPDGSPGDFTMVGAVPVGLPESQFFDVPTCNRPLPDDPAGTFRKSCLHPSVDWVIKGFGLDQADNGYYPDSQSAANATPIAVDPGQEVTGIDLQLRPKSPNPTITGFSQQYFVTGTTTAGVRIFGTGFPADPNAIGIEADSSNFFFPAVDITVTSVISPTELIATIAVQPGDVGAVPIQKALSMTTSIGGNFYGGPNLLFGDPATQVASISGRVTDSRGRPVANAGVVLLGSTLDVFGNLVQITATTGNDGRWSAQGVTPGTYTVRFDGTETLSGQYWRQKSRAAEATMVTLRNGDARTGINASLERRGPVKVHRAASRYQTANLSFDLVGEGLSPIQGGFRVSVVTPFGLFPLQAEYVSPTRLHVTGFAFTGTWDVVTEWTGNDGLTKSTTCVQCITVYDELGGVFAYENFVYPGTTTTVVYFGNGLVDITKVAVGGTGVSVQSFAPTDGGLAVTFVAKSSAALGPRTVTITRIDGSTTTAELVVGVPF